MSDLKYCLEYNPQSFEFADINGINATIEGERDGDDWFWIITLRSGQVGLLTGGCDYTGWD